MKRFGFGAFDVLSEAKNKRQIIASRSYEERLARPEKADTGG